MLPKHSGSGSTETLGCRTSGELVEKLTFVLDPGLEFALLELKSGPLVFKSTGMPKESTVRDEERLEKIMSNFKWSIL